MGVGNTGSQTSNLSEMVIDYQDLYIIGNMITLSWFLNDSCSESFEVQEYILNASMLMSQGHEFTVGKSHSSITIMHTSSDISYKLVALNATGAECPSTRDIYYTFGGNNNFCILYGSSYPVVPLQNFLHVKKKFSIFLHHVLLFLKPMFVIAV